MYNAIKFHAFKFTHLINLIQLDLADNGTVPSQSQTNLYRRVPRGIAAGASGSAVRAVGIIP